MGRRLGGRAARLTTPRAIVAIASVLTAVPVATTLALARVQGWDSWGGLMVSVFIAASSLTLCIPLGVLLALGRRSRMPLLRIVSVVHVEVFRGAPLFVLLLLANNALELVVPRGSAPGVVSRAIVVLSLFTAAYLAEIVRGGLQAVEPGQLDASRALGLGPGRTTLFVVLPQALRSTVPAQIGQLISLFKDVSLAGIAMGVFDLVRVSTSITKQPGFAGQHLDVESLAFVALLFWVGAFTMSRESRRLESALGVGRR
jgi:general L-amino acid transport system permease protein